MIRQARIFDEECEHHHGNDERSEAILIPSSFSLSDKQGCDLQASTAVYACSSIINPVRASTTYSKLDRHTHRAVCEQNYQLREWVGEFW